MVEFRRQLLTSFDVAISGNSCKRLLLSTEPVTMAAAVVVVSPVVAWRSSQVSSCNEQVCASPRRSLPLWSTTFHGQKLASFSVTSSSRLSSQNKRFTRHSRRAEKLMLGAVVKNEICDIRPMANSAEKEFLLSTRTFLQVLETLAVKVLQVGGAVVKNEICDTRPMANSVGKGFVNFTRRSSQILETLAVKVLQVGDTAREAVQKPTTQEEVQLLAALKRRMVCATAPLLVAAISQSVNTPLTVVASGMAKWLELYSGVLMVRVLLSWFPNIPWERQPLQAMRDMCDPYLNLFRNIIPPLFNALDLSPMLAFLVLGVLTSILNTAVQAS